MCFGEQITVTGEVTAGSYVINDRTLQIEEYVNETWLTVEVLRLILHQLLIK